MLSLTGKIIAHASLYYLNKSLMDATYPGEKRGEFYAFKIKKNKIILFSDDTRWFLSINSLLRWSRTFDGYAMWSFTGTVESVVYGNKEVCPETEIFVFGNCSDRYTRECEQRITLKSEKSTFEKLKEELS